VEGFPQGTQGCQEGTREGFQAHEGQEDQVVIDTKRKYAVPESGAAFFVCTQILFVSVDDTTPI